MSTIDSYIRLFDITEALIYETMLNNVTTIVSNCDFIFEITLLHKCSSTFRYINFDIKQK